MILIDTNVLIYASKGLFNIDTLLELTGGYSSVTKIEALGFPELPANQARMLEQLFAEYDHLTITEAIIEQSIVLRQTRKMKLGDAIIAATALVHDLKLWTSNTKDFEHIDGLKLHDPLE